MWAVPHAPRGPEEAQPVALQKLKLYDGKVLPGYTQDTVKELRKETAREGMDGISPRYVQDKISNALVNDVGEGTINPFMVLNELEKGLRHHSLITNDESASATRVHRHGEARVRRHRQERGPARHQRRRGRDPEARANYIDAIKAFT
jgi:serine protein kinase